MNPSRSDPGADAGVPADSADIDEILRELQHGRGRERVTDDNVKALIALAHERGDAQLELLLREWQSPCGEGAGSLPATLPLTRPPAECPVDSARCRSSTAYEAHSGERADRSPAQE